MKKMFTTFEGSFSSPKLQKIARMPFSWMAGKESPIKSDRLQFFGIIKKIY